VINIYFKVYIIVCLSLFLSGLYLCIKKFNQLEIFKSEYWSFLFRPWKLITFIIAFISFNLIAPFSGDPTWDLYTSSAMSLLTYLSAPWAIGIFYKFTKGKISKTILFIAFIMLMLSSSWCYDWYLVVKQGSYPETWFSNIFLSSIVYIAAGLYWNIEFRLTKGITLAFLYDDWLKSEDIDYSFKKIWWVILVTTLPVAVLFISFLFTIGAFVNYL
tara:strand:+ start:128 stop:775 length:648 start_codon:yes stop_codon:yes gene_type:complete